MESQFLKHLDLLTPTKCERFLSFSRSSGWDISAAIHRIEGVSIPVARLQMVTLSYTHHFVVRFKEFLNTIEPR